MQDGNIQRWWRRKKKMYIYFKQIYWAKSSAEKNTIQMICPISSLLLSWVFGNFAYYLLIIVMARVKTCCMLFEAHWEKWAGFCELGRKKRIHGIIIWSNLIRIYYYYELYWPLFFKQKNPENFLNINYIISIFLAT